MGGTQSLDPQPPPWVRGSIYKKKICTGPRSKSTHSGRNKQRSFDPPPPAPPQPPTCQKWGTQVRGVEGSKSKDSSGDHRLSISGDVPRGWTSNTTTWGMLRERTQ